MNVRPSYDSIWRKRLDALNNVWDEFLSGESEALHKARVASRRIREALPVVAAEAPSSKVKKLRRKVRGLTRELGPIRELDVELSMLDKEASDRSVPRPAVVAVRREVVSERHRLRERLYSSPPVTDVKKLIKKLERVAGQRKKRESDERKGSERGLKRERMWRAALATA